MQFEEVWQEYDFTEAELLSMGWQFPNDYVLNLNYYWELNSSNNSSEVATVDQPLKLILQSCIRLEVRLNPNPIMASQTLTNLGTIVGWGQVNPSPWLEELSLTASEWIHLFFEIGGDNKIEALVRSLTIEQLAKPPLAIVGR
ncbi:hypothetical protein [Oscillatoria salina]|uniref:hypothetical protein n=1 Tax=Oscillatoria salina TaxID=331517 RepID=UPI0013B97D95|nr:hypothetical protein [Oscillatoria salina]MBZ8180505.1 hypothetical protein [Oscillatoria salina IIICB1]NET91420.1 hypothetical protein [Kamptonema sp. SIO1D9]